VKERLVTCNEEDTDGRARVTRDEERFLKLLALLAFITESGKLFQVQITICKEIFLRL